MPISIDSEFKAVSPGIYVSDNAIDPKICNEIISEFTEHEKWKQAKITKYEFNEHAQGEMIVMLDTEKRIAERVHYTDVDIAQHPYSAVFFDYVRTEVLSLIQKEFGLITEEFGEAEIVRYPTGGIFIPHADSNKLKPYRAFSVILYLNDDFEGGETRFPNIGYSCVPKTGRVLIFPSHALHGGDEVISGEKQIIVLWVFYPGGIED